MKYTYSLLFCFLFILRLSAQYTASTLAFAAKQNPSPQTGGANCNNLDFSDGTHNGWTGQWNSLGVAGQDGSIGWYGGLNTNGFNASGGYNQNPFAHELCNNPNAVDRNCGILQVPPGHSYSIKLGSDSASHSNVRPWFHQTCSNTFMVTSANANIVYWYAVVFSQNVGDPHDETDQPFFKIRMHDAAGNELQCAHYDVNATSAAQIGGFQNIAPYTGANQTGYEVVYKNWTPVMIPLTNYIGQNVTITFESSDCNAGAHFGYAYLAVDCSPPQLILSTPLPCTGGTATMTAPFGALAYSWTASNGGNIVGSANQQTASFNQSGTYAVTMTVGGQGGINCTLTIDTVFQISTSAPIANFTVTDVCLGNPVPIVNTSVDNSGSLLTYHWNFGNGPADTSNIQSPVYQYNSVGTYTITLTVTNAGGCIDTATQVVNIINGTQLTIVSDSVYCPGEQVPAPVINGTNSATLTWVNSNPAIGLAASGTGIPPAFVALPNPNTTGSTVSAVITVSPAQSACPGPAVSYTVMVKPSPQVDPITNKDFCVGAVCPAINFNATPTGSSPVISWTADNIATGISSASGTGNIPSFTTTNTGTTSLSSVIQVNVDLNGCPGPVNTFTITVNPSPLITITIDSLYCPGDPVPAPLINASPNTSLAWVNTNPAIGLGASGTGVPPSFNALPNPNLSGNTVSGIVTVSPTIGSCAGPPVSYPLVVKPTPIVNPLTNLGFCPNVNSPAINFTATPSGGTPNFFWTATNTTVGLASGSGTGNFPAFTTVNSGTTIQSSLVLVYASLNGCPGPTTTFTVDVYPFPLAKYTTSGNVCEGKPISFTDQSTVGSGSIMQWAWDFNADGQFNESSSQNPSYTFSPAGAHAVALQVTTDKGCVSQTNGSIYINPIPIPDFSGDILSGCPVHPVNFTANATIAAPAGISSYTWNFGNGNTSSSPNPYTVYYTNTSGTQNAYYSVNLTVVSDSGCSAQISKPNYITVYPQPIAGFSWYSDDGSAPDLFNPLIHFYNQSQGTGTLSWNFGDIFTTDPLNNVSSLPNPDHNYGYEAQHTYYVTQWIKNQYGCRDSVVEPVTIEPIFTFYIPNAFTPNGDNRNEGFKGTGIGIDLPTYNLWIFDRWGNMIFYSNNLEETWDGKVQGKGTEIVLQDVYVWKVKFKDFRGRRHDYKGTVTVVK